MPIWFSFVEVIGDCIKSCGNEYNNHQNESGILKISLESQY